MITRDEVDAITSAISRVLRERFQDVDGELDGLRRRLDAAEQRLAELEGKAWTRRAS